MARRGGKPGFPASAFGGIGKTVVISRVGWAKADRPCHQSEDGTLHFARTQLFIREAEPFNLKYRKSDIAGRFHGGVFKMYASMGGRHASVGHTT